VCNITKEVIEGYMKWRYHGGLTLPEVEKYYEKKGLSAEPLPGRIFERRYLA
jgi:hypothetical protein